MAKPLISMISSEAAPFSRTGGLGDVVGSLSQAMTGRNFEVCVFLPWYQSIRGALPGIRSTGVDVLVQIGGQGKIARIGETVHEGVRYYFVGGEYFNRAGSYGDPQTGIDYPDNDERFSFFVRAALKAASSLHLQPSLWHLHDWQTALLPLYMVQRAKQHHQPVIPTLLTIHNLGYQGSFDAARFPLLELTPDVMVPIRGPLEFYGRVNFLKAGIVTASKVSTVSPRYAKEILTPEFGFGLDGVLRMRGNDLCGITNGIDTDIWTPLRDPFIPFAFGPLNLSRKRMNKIEFLRHNGMPFREHAPLIGMVTRFAEQKGIDLVIGALPELMKRNCQLFILGSGERHYADSLQEFAQKYPDRIKVAFTFDEPLSRRILAASDLVLMPSRYEPCGLFQLYGMRYGALPIVHAVGGLKDTVVDIASSPKEGRGFVFEKLTVEAMLASIDTAFAHFAKRRAWSGQVKHAMGYDSSWGQSARIYEQLYSAMIMNARGAAQ
jgi:starch synthase